MLASTEQDLAAPIALSGRLSWRVSLTLYHVAAIAVLGAVFIVGIAPKLDTDLWWHLRTGAYIASHHAIPSRDFLSFTAQGHTWTDYEWLAELAMYGLFRLAGQWGPLVVFAAVICATFGFVYLNMLQRKVHPFIGLFVLTASLVAAGATLGARIQMLTLLFLAIYSVVLYRFQATRDLRLLAVFPALMLLWVNLHGGFVIGLAVIGIWLLGEALNSLAKRDDALTPRQLRALFFSLIASFAVTAVNPNGVRQMLFPFTLSFPNAYTNHLNEWAAVDFHMFQMMVFEGLILLLIAAAFIVRSRLNWTQLLLVLAFTHLALTQMRNVPVWVVLVSPILAEYLQALYPLRRRLSAGRPLVSLLMLIGILGVYSVEASHFVSAKAIQRTELQTFPAGAAAYMQTHSLPPKVFASYAWGGYVDWKLYPRYRVFIDGRANSVFDSKILFEYMDAYSASSDWQSILRRNHVGSVLVEPSAPLAQTLRESKQWRRQYEDGTAVLFTRQMSS